MIVQLMEHFSGGCKLVVSLGQGLFSVKSLAEYWNDSNKDGLKSNWAKSVGGVEASASFLTNLSIRYFRMQKSENIPSPPEDLMESAGANKFFFQQAEDILLDIPSMIENPQPVQPEEMSWGSKATQVASQLFTAGFGVMNGFTGYLSAFTIGQFTASIFDDEINDADWKFYLLHACALILAASNFKSYMDSNFANIKDDYLPAALDGKWKTYGWSVWSLSLFMVLMQAVNAKFSNDHTIDLLNDYTLTKIHSDLAISGAGQTFFNIFAVSTTAVNFALVTPPTSDKLLKKRFNQADKYKKQIQDCYRFNPLIIVAILIDSLATGVVNSVALARSLKNIFGINDQAVSIKSTIFLPGVAVFLNSFAANIDAWHKELDRRIANKENLEKWEEIRPDLEKIVSDVLSSESSENLKLDTEVEKKWEKISVDLEKMISAGVLSSEQVGEWSDSRKNIKLVLASPAGRQRYGFFAAATSGSDDDLAEALLPGHEVGHAGLVN